MARLSVMVSIPFWDEAKARAIEPFVTTPARRVRTIERLAQRGHRVGVMVAPIIPGLNDEDIGEVLRAARDAGADARRAACCLRLPGPVKEVFEERLRAALPLRADRVLRRIRETRGGKMYDARFGVRGTRRGRLRRGHRARSSSRRAQKLGFEHGGARPSAQAPPPSAGRGVSWRSSEGSQHARRASSRRGRSGRRSGPRRSATPGRRRSARAPRAVARTRPPAFAQPPTQGAAQPGTAWRASSGGSTSRVDEPRAAQRPPRAVFRVDVQARTARRAPSPTRPARATKSRRTGAWNAASNRRNRTPAAEAGIGGPRRSATNAS